MTQEALPGREIPPPSTRASSRPLVRGLFLVISILCLTLGVIGVFVPGLPTTVFVLMAAWAAARSSPRLYAWLWYHRLFGPMLRDWSQGGLVRRSAKWKASVAMMLCMAILLLTASQRWAAVLGCFCMGCVLVWLWCRPEPAKPVTSRNATELP